MDILTRNAARCDFDILKEVCIFGLACWMIFQRRWILIEGRVAARVVEKEGRSAWVLGLNRRVLRLTNSGSLLMF